MLQWEKLDLQRSEERRITMAKNTKKQAKDQIKDQTKGQMKDQAKSTENCKDCK